jgi:hypothetical protein
VLGYSTWEAYVRTEFDMSRSRSYQILDHAKVTKELVSASGVSTSVDISEAAARELKPVLHQVITRIHERLAEGDPDADPAEVVNEEVEKFREELDQAEFEADMDREYAEYVRKEREKRQARRQPVRAAPQEPAAVPSDLIDQFKDKLQVVCTLLFQMDEAQRFEASRLLWKLMDDYGRAHTRRRRRRTA